MMLNRISLLALSFLLLAGFESAAKAEEGANYVKTIEAWRAERLAHLTQADGWLALIGLHWLKQGANRIGSAEDNDVIFAKGPGRLGTVNLQNGKATIELHETGALVDGKNQTRAELLDDSHETPTRVSFGTVNFYLIKRGDRYGLRVKDSEAQTRTRFAGLDYFDIDPSWRIEARWEAFASPREIEISNVIGTIEKYPAAGEAVFERDGKTYRVTPYTEVPGDSQLFIVFADRTSGKETYGAARFLYVDPPKNGKLIVDFNRAYNPPCAFTPFATCPLPPKENRLDLRVTAGEKKYRGAHK